MTVNLGGDEWLKLMTTVVDLDSELELYVSEGPLKGTQSLRHPLVYHVPYVPKMAGMANLELKAKIEALKRARSERNWLSYIYLHERPYRVDAFTDICLSLSNREYWKLLGGIYTDTENLYQNKDLWIQLSPADRDRRFLMDDEERVSLRKDNANVITVYRGYCESGDPHGLSWTTNRVVAKFFARRLAPADARQFVATATVRKRQVLAYFNGRSKQEMVILPEHTVRGAVDEIGVNE